MIKHSICTLYKGAILLLGYGVLILCLMQDYNIFPMVAGATRGELLWDLFWACPLFGVIGYYINWFLTLNSSIIIFGAFVALTAMLPSCFRVLFRGVSTAIIEGYTSSLYYTDAMSSRVYRKDRSQTMLSNFFVVAFWRIMMLLCFFAIAPILVFGSFIGDIGMIVYYLSTGNRPAKKQKSGTPAAAE